MLGSPNHQAVAVALFRVAETKPLIQALGAEVAVLYVQCHAMSARGRVVLALTDDCTSNALLAMGRHQADVDQQMTRSRTLQIQAPYRPVGRMLDGKEQRCREVIDVVLML